MLFVIFLNIISLIIDEPESNQVKFDVGGNDSKSVDVDSTIDTLQAEDPWLQRKREENNNN